MILYKKANYVIYFVIGLIIALSVFVLAWTIFPRIQNLAKGTEEITGLSPKAIMSDADEAFNNEYYEEAIRLYRDFLVKFPKHSDAFKAQFQIGQSYFEIGNCNEQLYDEEFCHKALIAYRSASENYKVNKETELELNSKIQYLENLLE